MHRILTVALVAAATLTFTSAAGATVTASHPHRKHSAGHAHRTVAMAPVDSRNPVTTAAAIAERYWGATPCGGKVTITAASPLVSGLDAGTDGWVTFNSSLGADNLDAPASTYTDCTISLARWQWANWTQMEADWGMFCLTVTHEMGHLLGYKHTLVPGSVMNPVFTNDADVPAACNAAWLPGWRAA
jgi:hypothetical protein